MWQRDATTDRVHAPSVQSVVPSECLQTQDSHRTSFNFQSEYDDNGSSTSTSLCWVRNNDYGRAAEFQQQHHSFNDEAAEAAHPRTKTSPDFDIFNTSLAQNVG